MLWVPVGSCRSMMEAMARFRHVEENGTAEPAFGWAYLKDANLWITANCDEAVRA